MASLAVAGPSAPAAEPLHPEAAKRRCRPARGAGAWARVLSMGVQGCVMAAAFVLFLLFAFAACVLMMALVFAARAFRRHGPRYPNPPDRPEPPLRPVGLAAAQISSLACFQSSRCDPTPPTCAVCLEASRGGERWRALPPCGHAFHAACVDSWLLLSPACPVCRTTVAVPTISECLAGVGSHRHLGM
uniref:Uncharacterized protein n=1 Tax=Avena sativa TaxID=4498 RepID=A0ACD6ALD4_AVESA